MCALPWISTRKAFFETRAFPSDRRRHRNGTAIFAARAVRHRQRSRPVKAQWRGSGAQDHALRLLIQLHAFHPPACGSPPRKQFLRQVGLHRRAKFGDRQAGGKGRQYALHGKAHGLKFRSINAIAFAGMQDVFNKTYGFFHVVRGPHFLRQHGNATCVRYNTSLAPCGFRR